MSETQLATRSAEKEMEIVPFGAQDAIKLSVGIVCNLIAVRTKSGKTCSERDAMKFMMMCRARRLNPFEGDAFLIGYDGKDGPQFSLITAHQAFLKRAELHPEYDGMESGIIYQGKDDKVVEQEGDFHLKEQKVIGGWARVHFKSRKHPTYRRLRLERFMKPYGVWQEDPAGMICKCAEADALRSSFPTMLGGLYMKEEIEAGMRSHELTIGNESAVTLEAPDKASILTPLAATEPTKTPQQQLADSLGAAGMSFTDFRMFCEETGNAEACDVGSYDELSTPFAKRMLNSRAKIIQVFADSKGGAK